jgi:hypothetical protein
MGTLTISSDTWIPGPRCGSSRYQILASRSDPSRSPALIPKQVMPPRGTTWKATTLGGAAGDRDHLPSVFLRKPVKSHAIAWKTERISRSPERPGTARCSSIGCA